MPSPNINEEIAGPDTYRVNGGAPVQFGYSAIFAKWRWTSSVKTPNYKELVKRRALLPDQDYTYQYVVYDDPRQTAGVNRYYLPTGALHETVEYLSSTYSFVGSHSFNRTVSADDPWQIVSGKLLELLRSGKTDIMVTLAEADKTAAMVAKTAVKLANSFRALKQLRFGDFALELGLARPERVKRRLGRKWRRWKTEHGDNTRDFAANSWLEYSYGWKPLLKDVYQSAETFASLLVEYQLCVRSVRAKASTKEVGETVEAPSNNHWTTTYKSSDQRWCDALIRYSLPSHLDPGIACGLTNPAIVAWELMPFSFVVDWFLPIGDYLSNLTATHGLTFHSGWKAEKNVHVKTVTCVGERSLYSFGLYVAHPYGKVRGEKSWFSLERRKIYSFPSVPLPAFKDPRSFSHATSAIALLSSIFLPQRR